MMNATKKMPASRLPDVSQRWDGAHDLLDQLGGGVVLLDADLSVQFINTAMLPLLGLESTAILGQLWPLTLLSPETEQWTAWLKKVRAGQESHQVWSVQLDQQSAKWWVSARRFISKHQHYFLLLIHNVENRSMPASPLSELFPLGDVERIAHLGSWFFDLSSNHFSCSDEMLHLLDLDPLYFEGSYGALLERIYPEDRLRFNEKIEEAKRRLSGFEMELRIASCNSGKVREVVLRGEVSADGRRIFGTMLDVTEHQRQVEGLRLAATVVRYTAEGVVVCDKNNHIVAVNPAFTQITGYSEEEVRGHSPSILRSGKHEKGFYREMWRSIQTEGLWIGEIWNRRKEGDVYPCWLNISCVYDGDGLLTHYVGVFADISSLKRSQERLDFLANHDSLTGLANRRLFIEQLNTAVEHARREGEHLAVLFVDLDRFKEINDSLGHHVGDELLIEVARRMKASVRVEDVVARQGGDEFVILLNGIKTIEVAVNVATKVREFVFQAYSIEGNVFHLSCSVGVAIFPDDGDTPEKLLAVSDSAMYRAKTMGRNQCAFASDELSRQAYSHYVLEVGLRHALEQGGVKCVYNSYVSFDSQQLVAVRADWYWEHPWLGEIPADFLDEQVRQSVLALALGNFVLKTACAAMVSWQSTRHLRCPLVIPVQASLFRLQEFVPLLKSVLKETGLDPHLLWLEIDSSLLVGNVTHTQSVIGRLPVGIRLVISGMGRAVLSLPALQVWPVAALCLDPLLIRDIHEDSRDLSLVSALAAMTVFLDVEVWAGPVLNATEYQLLRKAGLSAVSGPALAAKGFPAQGIINP